MQKLGLFLSLKKEESKYCLTSYKKDDTKSDKKHSFFCFFELFFIPPRDKYQPSCIDDHYYSKECEETIDICEYFSENIYSIAEVFCTDLTCTDPDIIFTSSWWFSIESSDEDFRYTDEDESDCCINDDIFSLFELFFIPPSCDDRIERVYCHSDEAKRSQKEHNIDYWFEYIDPECPCETTINIEWIRSTFEIERAPYRVGYLHHKNSDRNPYDVVFPFFLCLFVPSREEKLQYSNDKEYSSNRDEEVFDRSGNIEKNIGYRRIATRYWRVEEVHYWTYETPKFIILCISTDRHLGSISDIDIIYCKYTLNWKETSKYESDNKKDTAHRKEFRNMKMIIARKLSFARKEYYNMQ